MVLDNVGAIFRDLSPINNVPKVAHVFWSTVVTQKYKAKYNMRQDLSSGHKTHSVSKRKLTGSGT